MTEAEAAAFPVFPVWTLVDSPMYHQRGIPSGLVFCPSPGAGPVFPVFTELAKAREYALAKAPDKEYEPYPINDGTTLAKLLGYAINPSVQNVGINCRAGRPYQSQPAEAYTAIQPLLDRFRVKK